MTRVASFEKLQVPVNVKSVRRTITNTDDALLIGGAVMIYEQPLKCVTSHPYWSKRFAPVLTAIKQEPNLEMEISLRGGWIIGYKHLMAPPKKEVRYIDQILEYRVCEHSVNNVFATVANLLRSNHVENGIIDFKVNIVGSKRRLLVAGYSNKKMKSNDRAIVKKDVFI